MYTPGGCGTDLAPMGMSGLGCPDCGGTCGMSGLSMDGSGLFGTGIFGTGVVLTDFSTWGMGEYATLALGAYVLLSLTYTTKAAGRRVSRKVKGVKKGLKS